MKSKKINDRVLVFQLRVGDAKAFGSDAAFSQLPPLSDRLEDTSSSSSEQRYGSSEAEPE